jgi:hypothetical protein
VLLLDAHSNLLSTGSVDTDFRGFTVFIGSSSRDRYYDFFNIFANKIGEKIGIFD